MIAAIRTGNTAAVKRLLEQGQVDWNGDDGEALFMASDLCLTPIVKLLLKYDAPHRRSEGFTPLTSAAFKGATEIAIALLEHGATHEASPGGFSPIVCSSWKGHVEITRILLKSGAFPGGYRQKMPLFYAAKKRGDICWVTIKLLLEYGADPTETDLSVRIPIILY